MDNRVGCILYPSDELFIESGGFGSAYGSHVFVCSKCGKNYFTSWNCRHHYSKCQLDLSDGIHVIDRRSPKKLKEVVRNLGFLSKVTQRIDMSVTSMYKVNDSTLRTKVFLLVHNGNSIGILTTTLRTFEKENVTIKWLDDFYVMQPYQRKGFGTALYEFALKYHNAGPYDFLYDQPKPPFLALLKKRGIDIKKLNSRELFKRKSS